MAIRRRTTRTAMCFAGVVCLVAGLFPYYARTSQPARVEVPGPESLPDRPSETVVLLGLPFSPVFQYRRVDTVSVETSASPATGDTGQSGPTASSAQTKATKFSVGSSSRWGVELLSWSTAVIVAGVILLVLTFRGPGRHAGGRERVEAGEKEAEKQAGHSA